MYKFKTRDSVVPQSTFDIAYDKLLAAIKNKSINASDLVFITATVIGIVERSMVSDNAEKKQFAIDLIQKVVSSSGLLSPDNQAAADAFIQNVLPGLIDTMIDIAKQKIDIGKIKSKCCCVM